MGTIKSFENADLGLKIRVFADEKGDPLFVASELAKGLGYRDANSLTRTLDEDEKGTQIVRTLGGEQQMSVITESGFYHAALKSRVPQAKAFRKWVTSEVLPQIRQTGGYIPMGDPLKKEKGEGKDEKSLSDDEILSRALLIAQKTIELKNHLLQEQKPMVQFANALVASDSSILIGDLAKLITQNGFEIGRTRLFQWLRRKGYLFQHENRPIQKYVEQGLFELNVTLIETHHGMKESFTTKVTAKGQQYFINLFIK